jgi:hypothetical protein
LKYSARGTDSGGGITPSDCAEDVVAANSMTVTPAQSRTKDFEFGAFIVNPLLFVFLQRSF